MAENVRLIITNMTYRGSTRRMCILEEDRKIVEIRPESTENGAAQGDVYMGQVENAPGNLDAVFVRISPDERCYLPLKDTQNAVYSSGTGNRTKPKAGDELLVQVTRGKMKTKLSAVSAQLSFPGRYLVLTTGKEGLMFSKKLSANDKERLKRTLDTLEIHAETGTATEPGFGLLIRTEAVQASKEDLLREYQSLREIYVAVAINGSHRTLYSRLYRPDPDYIGMLKDLKEETAETILTDDRDVMEHISAWCRANAPSLIPKIKLYEDKLLPLPKLISLERTLDEALKKQVWLKCGGYLVIEPTEAFISIDVNTGKYVSKKKPEEGFREVNREAAEEIARQLRLRNLSGMILIDFINMQNPDHNEELLDILKKLTKKDPVQTEVIDMTALHIVEATRKKVRQSLYETLIC